jgi:primosomal protein N' (replication factor Y)
VSGARVARVVVDTPLPQLDRLFDYAIPERLHEAARPGVRVTVPLRSAGRLTAGYLVDVVERSDFDGTLAELESVVSAAEVLSPSVYRLARRVADRAAGSVSDVLRLAIPPRMVRVEKAWLAARNGDDEDDGEGTAASPVPVAGRIGGYRDDLAGTAVAERRRIALDVAPRVKRLRSGEWVGGWAITLAEAAARALAHGRSAILAVPDHGDLDQLHAALRDLVPDDAITRLDAAQPNPERYRAFLRCLEPRPCAVIGNRSAVYAPAHRLGLLALWDDSDPLHAEPLAPYAHDRDVALLRADDEHCALVFAGHTRSLEVQRLVELGYLEAISPDPVVTPRVVVAAAQAGDGTHSRIPEGAWRAARDGLATGPVLVQVARPGYAPLVACARCGEAARCPSCGGPLALGSATAVPSCRWCGALAPDWSCPHCHGGSLRLVTRGSARTAEELGRAFPGSLVVVSDGERRLATVSERPALVVATRGAEPVAAGGYRAVLLLDGDRMLARESLHVGEDCLRWWSNAAALAAPGAPVVLAGVDGPLAHALATWRQPVYAAHQLADRRALRFAPAVRVATVTGTGTAVAAALTALPHDDLRVDVLGPSGDADAARAIVRFDYAAGADVASALRSAIVRQATAGRRVRGDRGRRPPPTLRVKFDDASFDDQA